jgi:hypothetical protein
MKSFAISGTHVNMTGFPAVVFLTADCSHRRLPRTG